MAKKQLLYDVEKEKIDEIISKTEGNSEYFFNTSVKVANTATASLDEILMKCNKAVSEQDEVPVHDLEKLLLELTNSIYFMYSNLEKLSIYEDLATANCKEKYNEAYLEHAELGKKPGEKASKPTVAEITATAESQTVYESVMSNLYGHAYQLVKNKIDGACRVADALKKVISHRMQEESLSNFSMDKNNGVGFKSSEKVF